MLHSGNSPSGFTHPVHELDLHNKKFKHAHLVKWSVQASNKHVGNEVTLVWGSPIIMSMVSSARVSDPYSDTISNQTLHNTWRNKPCRYVISCMYYANEGRVHWIWQLKNWAQVSVLICARCDLVYFWDVVSCSFSEETISKILVSSGSYKTVT